MKRLVEFPLQEGGSIFVQVDEPDTGGTVRAARGDIVEKAKGTFEEALSKVLPAINSVVVQLQGMESRPDEIEVTFGINLSIQAGPIAFISAGSETNFGVTVHWTGKAEEPRVVPLDGKSEPTANTP